MMKTKAAVLWEVNAPWSVEEIELDPPGPGEVLVKLAESGIGDRVKDRITGHAVRGSTGTRVYEHATPAELRHAIETIKYPGLSLPKVYGNKQ